MNGMFFAHGVGRGPMLIRKDAVRAVEPAGDTGVRLVVDGVGDIVTNTYDFDGFAAVVMDVEIPAGDYS